MELSMKIVDVGIGVVIRRNPDKIRINPHTSDSEYEILITRRPESTVFGGYWELPGGKLDPGEAVDECVVRELSEEVGVLVEVIGTLNDVVHTYQHATVRLHPRLCRLLPSSPPPSNLHVVDHHWCPVDGLGRFQFPPANEGIITELRKALRSGLNL